MVVTIFDSVPKIAVFGLSCFSAISIVLAAVTGETILLSIGTAGGVALGIVSLRDKLRDYRAEALQKQLASLHKQLEEERSDHERTRSQLRKFVESFGSHETS